MKSRTLKRQAGIMKPKSVDLASLGITAPVGEPPSDFGKWSKLPTPKRGAYPSP